MIDVKEKERLIDEARMLGKHYFQKYGTCAPTTVFAVCETLGMEVSDDVIKSVAPLSSFSGGCGGMCGAAVSLGLRFGKGLEEFKENHKLGGIIPLLHGVQSKFEDKYSSFLCKDIQSKLYGRSFDYRYSEDVKAYQSMIEEVKDKCSEVTSDAAGWAVETILNTEHPET